MGERNVYSLGSRGAVLCDATSVDSLIAQAATALAAGARPLLDGPAVEALIASISQATRALVGRASGAGAFAAVLTDRGGADLIAFQTAIARRDGPIASVFRVDAETLRRGEAPVDLLLSERSLCINTTAAGGNASLMSMG